MTDPIQQYLAHVERHSPRQSLHTARRALKIGPRDYTTAGLREWHRRLTEQYSASTANRYNSVIRSFLHFARKHELIHVPRDTIADHLTYERVKTCVPSVLRRSQIREILRYVTALTRRRARDRKLFTLLGLFTGMRPGELLALRHRHINVEDREIHVTDTKTFADRRVYYGTSTTLTTLMPRIIGNDWLPLRCKTAPWFKDMARSLDLPATDRGILRRTCESYTASSGRLTEFELAAQFGHNTATALKFYRQRIHDVTGDTIEQWMQCEREAITLAEGLQ